MQNFSSILPHKNGVEEDYLDVKLIPFEIFLNKKSNVSILLHLFLILLKANI
jgi:hypothetical protein